jgi:hypothetical protein
MQLPENIRRISTFWQGRRGSRVLGGGRGGGKGSLFPRNTIFSDINSIWNHIELNMDYSINLYWENINWVPFPIFHLYIYFYSNMFRIVKQRREVKFPLVYAGMLDHEDSDNTINFQFSDGSQQ